MKKRQALLLTCVVLCTSLIGCGGQSGQTVPESMITQEIIAQSTAALESPVQENANQGNAASSSENSIQKEADEEYVYDYQVSMDPIPKEIADLGGPCQGTIHAFPSKIRIGLTEKRMEEDPELKAEVEKRISEFEEFLEKNIGGKFRVDGVSIDTAFEAEWRFYCTEIASEFHFTTSYLNFSYYENKQGGDVSLRNLEYDVAGYYNAKATEEQKKLYEAIVFESFGDALTGVWIQEDFDCVALDIIQYTDEAVDKVAEQAKIAALWKKLREKNSHYDYTITLVYFPSIYREIIDQKYKQGNRQDTYFSEECLKKLKEKGEIIDGFFYEYFSQEFDGDEGLDILIEKQGDHFTEWKYWQ